MFLLHEPPQPIVEMVIGGAIILLLWTASAIASHNTRERERKAEKERQDAEQRRLELELLLKQKELELQEVQARKVNARNWGIFFSGFVTLAVYLLTHDLAVTAGAGSGASVLQRLWTGN